MKTIVMKLNYGRMAGLGVLCLFLAGVNASGQDTNNSSNAASTANMEPKTPTFDETIEWLKKQFAADDGAFLNSGKHLFAEQKMSITHFVDGHFVLEEDNKEIKSEVSGAVLYYHLKNTFELADVTNAWVQKDGEGFCVRFDMKSGKYVSCIEDDDSGVHHVSRDNYAYLFYTSDEEKARRMAKAFNHLIQVAPRDDLFK